MASTPKPSGELVEPKTPIPVPELLKSYAERVPEEDVTPPKLETKLFNVTPCPILNAVITEEALRFVAKTAVLNTELESASAKRPLRPAANEVVWRAEPKSMVVVKSPP